LLKKTVRVTTNTLVVHLQIVSFRGRWMAGWGGAPGGVCCLGYGDPRDKATTTGFCVTLPLHFGQIIGCPRTLILIEESNVCYWGSIPCMGNGGTCSLHVQTGIEVHTASYPIVISLGIKRPAREADRSPPSGSEFKNEWSYTSTHLVRLCGVVLN